MSLFYALKICVETGTLDAEQVLSLRACSRQLCAMFSYLPGVRTNNHFWFRVYRSSCLLNPELHYGELDGRSRGSDSGQPDTFSWLSENECIYDDSNITGPPGGEWRLLTSHLGGVVSERSPEECEDFYPETLLKICEDARESDSDDDYVINWEFDNSVDWFQETSHDVTLFFFRKLWQDSILLPDEMGDNCYCQQTDGLQLPNMDAESEWQAERSCFDSNEPLRNVEEEEITLDDLLQCVEDEKEDENENENESNEEKTRTMVPFFLMALMAYRMGHGNLDHGCQDMYDLRHFRTTNSNCEERSILTNSILQDCRKALQFAGVQFRRKDWASLMRTMTCALGKFDLEEIEDLVELAAEKWPNEYRTAEKGSMLSSHFTTADDYGVRLWPAVFSSRHNDGKNTDYEKEEGKVADELLLHNSMHALIAKAGVIRSG